MNLKEATVGASEVKRELSDIMTEEQTRIIMKNNKPTSVIMPYSKYVQLVASDEKRDELIQDFGTEVNMGNGTVMTVVASKTTDFGGRPELVVRVLYKTEHHSQYVEHYTMRLNAPFLETDAQYKLFDEEA